MNNFYPFPKIGQFRDVLRDMRNMSGTITFQGTVKVHGTNAAVVVEPDGNTYVQSRKRVITPEDDNYGFASWVMRHEKHFQQIAAELNDTHVQYQGLPLVIYGEWAGQGIQSGVAVSNVGRFFYYFAACYIDAGEQIWLTQEQRPLVADEANVILDSRTPLSMAAEVDLTLPAASQNDLVNLTESIEKSCPVGRWLGVEGIGEGMVWEYITEQGERFAFKVKGEKHAVSKVKTLAPVDPEKVKNIEEFLDYAVTENRLLQGLQEACDGIADRKHTGTFLKWVANDIFTEEAATLEASGLDQKTIGKPMGIRARTWFFDKIKQF